MPTTATDWLAENPGDIEALGEMLMDMGDLPIGIWTEIPEWMQKEIATQLTESFSQDYWTKIAETTNGDAASALRDGLSQGWSIRDIAKEMEDSLGGGQYARTRATNIARTEAGNALNGARKAATDRLKRDLPMLMIRRVWLSVLGTTTRDSHANLDGVPEDTEGLWELGGVRIPWPSHYRLPAGERCSCQCTTVDELGLGGEEANSLINDYYERISKGLVEGWLWTKFNPNHDSLGRFGTGGGVSGVPLVEVKLVKHLPGQHNQMSHAHGGGVDG